MKVSENNKVFAYKPNELNLSMPLVSYSNTYQAFACAKLAKIKISNPTKAMFFCACTFFIPQEQNIMITPNNVETIIAFIAKPFNYLTNNCCKVSAVNVNSG